MRKCRLGDLSAEDAAGHCFPMSIYSECEFNSPLELLSTVSLYCDLSGTFFCVQFFGFCTQGFLCGKASRRDSGECQAVMR